VANDGRVRDKLLASLAAGTGPDVYLLSREYLPNWALRELLLPLDPYLAADRVRPDMFYPGAYDACVWQGKTYGLPNMVEIWVQYLNKGALREAGLNPEKPPVTFDDIQAVAPKLTTRGDDGTITRAGFIPLWGNTGWYGMLRQAGSTLFTTDGRRAQAATPAAADALTWQVTFIERTYGSYAAMDAHTKSWGKGGGFVNGQVAIWVDWHWSMGRWNDEGARGVYGSYFQQLDYTPTQIPYPVNGRPLNILGGWAFVVARATNAPAAAWKFISFAMSAEGQKILRSGRGKNRDVLSGNRVFEESREAQMKAENPFRPFFLEQAAKYGTAWEKSPVEYARIMWKYLNPVHRGELAVKAALDHMTQELQAELDQAYAGR